MLSQRVASARFLGYHHCWQLSARRAARPQWTSVVVRSAASAADAEAPSASAAAELGPKGKLFKLLNPIDDPITSEELWPLAEAEGLKSKRFMKSLLNDLRRTGKLTTKPARGKSYGYILPEKWTALKKTAKKASAVEQSVTKSASSTQKATRGKKK